MSLPIKFLTTERCPHCGADPYEEKIQPESRYGSREPPTSFREHTCGGRWEERTFLCGLVVEWTPNFSREEFKGRCCNDKTHIPILEKRDAWITRVIKYIEKQGDVDKRFRKHVLKNFDGGYDFRPDNCTTLPWGEHRDDED